MEVTSFFITCRIYVLLREAFSSKILRLPCFLLVGLWFHFSSSYHWATWNAFWCKTESGSTSFSQRLPPYPSPVTTPSFPSQHEMLPLSKSKFPWLPGLKNGRAMATHPLLVPHRGEACCSPRPPGHPLPQVGPSGEGRAPTKGRARENPSQRAPLMRRRHQRSGARPDVQHWEALQESQGDHGCKQHALLIQWNEKA